MIGSAVAEVGGCSSGDNTGVRVTRDEIIAVVQVKGNKTLIQETVVVALRVEDRIKKYLREPRQCCSVVDP